jgi:hypothetical protein
MGRTVHGEAFCLMLYRCRNCALIEVIWNSRDGVTPFGVPCRREECNRTNMGSPMLHVEWHLDQVMPDFTPWPGMRIFRDGSVEEARDIMRRRLESAKGTEYELPPEKWDELIEHAVIDSFQPGWPKIELVPWRD